MNPPYDMSATPQITKRDLQLRRAAGMRQAVPHSNDFPKGLFGFPWMREVDEARVPNYRIQVKRVDALFIKRAGYNGDRQANRFGSVR